MGRTPICHMRFRGGQVREVSLPRQTLKIERENALAMSKGYHENSDLLYVSVYASGEDAVALRNDFDNRKGYVPKVLSYRTSQEPNYPISSVGRSMGVSDYSRPFSLPYKYVAIVDRIFFVQEDFIFNIDLHADLWREFCKNGIFDIWEPDAPFNRWEGNFDLARSGKKVIKSPQILLLRIFELDKPIMVKHRKTYTDTVMPGEDVYLKRPIIPFNKNDRFADGFYGTYYFADLMHLIRTTLSDLDALERETLVNDTSLINVFG